MAESSWTEMDPRRRRRSALALATLMVVVMAVTAMAMWAATNDGVVVVLCAVVALWFASLMVVVAYRPSLARTWGLLSLIPLGLSPILLAYANAR